MSAYRLRNGNYVVPLRGVQGGTLGDTLVVISSIHPEYEKWERFVQIAPPEIEAEFGNHRGWDGKTE